MKTVIILLLTMFVSSVSAQKYLNGKIELTDGKVLPGYIKLIDTYSKEVTYKPSEKGEKKELKNEDVKTVIYYYEKDTIEFVKETIIINGKKKGLVWLQRFTKGFCSLYLSSDEFSIGQSLGDQKSSTSFYLKREGEEGASLVGVYLGKLAVNVNASFIKIASQYFSDYPELVKRLQNKEFKILECPTVVIEYNKWKNQKANK